MQMPLPTCQDPGRHPLQRIPGWPARSPPFTTDAEGELSSALPVFHFGLLSNPFLERSFFFSLFSRLCKPRIVFALSSSRLYGRSSSSSSESSSESYASSVALGGWMEIL